MNRDKLKGFVCGIAVMAVAAGIGGAAWAASRTIQVEDGISVTIDGAVFTPRDVNGREVPLFLSDGTIYAPVRAIGEAAGYDVSYDAASRTAILKTPGQTQTAQKERITADEARTIALARVTGGTVVQCELDYDDGKYKYEIELVAGGREYDCEIDAETGTVLKWEMD